MADDDKLIRIKRATEALLAKHGDTPEGRELAAAVSVGDEDTYLVVDAADGQAIRTHLRPITFGEVEAGEVASALTLALGRTFRTELNPESPSYAVAEKAERARAKTEAEAEVAATVKKAKKL